MRVSVSLLAASVLACAFALGGCGSKEKKIEPSPIPLTSQQCMTMGGSVGADKKCPHTVTKMFAGNLEGQFRCSFPGRPGICIDNGR